MSIETPLVLGRYLLGEALPGRPGRAVHRARDRLLGEPVVVKFTSPGERRAEAGRLRLLRIPGVVELLDEGVTPDGRGVVVTRWVSGAAFPGAGSASPDDIVAVAGRLLQVLDRIHRLGLVHGDLQPAHVRVGDDGRITLLDFEDAAAVGPRAVLGTGPYLSPERLMGRPPSVEGDLYAWACLVYEALAGRLPRAGGQGLRFDRSPPTPPGLDPRRGSLLLRCLAIHPQARPASAATVLRAWGGPRRRWPLLGRVGLLERLQAAPPASVALVGPVGSGRSRLLRRLARVGDVRVRATGAALTDLAQALGVVLDPGWDLAAGLRHLGEAAAALAERGHRLLIDDLDQLDRWSRALVLAHEGPVVVVSRSAEGLPEGWRIERLEPLGAEELRRLVAAPERLLHLPSDVAEELLRRTGGHPARLVAELDQWVQSGLSAVDEAGQLVLERSDLERIRLALPPMRSAAGAPADPLQAALLGWLQIAAMPLSERQLRALEEAPRWQLEAALEALRAQGRVEAREGGWSAPASWPAGWDAARCRAARRDLGALLPAGHPRRLPLLLAGGALGPARPELLQRALVAIDRGRAEEAVGLLRIALASKGPGGEGSGGEGSGGEGSEPVDAAVELLVHAALCSGRRRLVDLALHALHRGADPLWLAGEQLLRAWCAAAGSQGERALGLLRAGPPVSAPASWQVWWWSVRVWAARWVGLDRERALVEEGALACAGLPDGLGAAANWRGRLAYREGHYRAAATAFEEAAALRMRSSARLSALLSAGSAWLEAGEDDTAQALALRARGLAASTRQPVYEARAVWLERAAAYRSGHPLPPDPALRPALEALGAPEVSGLLLLQEAASARALGQHEEAVVCGLAAAAAWRRSGWSLTAALAEAVALDCGAALPPGPLIEAALAGRLPGPALQILALLAPHHPLDEEAQRAAAGQAARLRLASVQAEASPTRWTRPREVLSLAEIHSRLQLPESEEKSA